MSSPNGPLELPPGLSLDNTLGALLSCIVVAVALFGAICIQTFNYFNDYPLDKRYLKIMVSSVWCLELCHTIFIFHSLYKIMVSSFGTFGFLIDIPWTVKASILCSGLINSIVQSFFTNRIRIISGRWTIPVICWILLLLRFICVIASSVLTLTTELAVFAVKFNWLLTILLVATFIVDVVVACAVAYFLAKSRTGFLRSDRLIRRLILFSIETGLITSVIATVVLIIFLTKPHTFTWIGLLLILAKVYSNSLLYSLNARRHLRSDASLNASILKPEQSGSNPNSIGLGRYAFGNNSRGSRNTTRAVAIEMNTLTSVSPADNDAIGGSTENYKRAEI